MRERSRGPTQRLGGGKEGERGGRGQGKGRKGKGGVSLGLALGLETREFSRELE